MQFSFPPRLTFFHAPTVFFCASTALFKANRCRAKLGHLKSIFFLPKKNTRSLKFFRIENFCFLQQHSRSNSRILCFFGCCCFPRRVLKVTLGVSEEICILLTIETHSSKMVHFYELHIFQTL
jgi:hypothetical protein